MNTPSFTKILENALNLLLMSFNALFYFFYRISSFKYTTKYLVPAELLLKLFGVAAELQSCRLHLKDNRLLEEVTAHQFPSVIMFES
jgi:hypothetical protein